MLLNKQFLKKAQKEFDQVFQARYREAQALESTKQKQKKLVSVYCFVSLKSIFQITVSDLKYHIQGYSISQCTVLK